MSQLKPLKRAEQGKRPIFEINRTKIDWKTPAKDVGLVTGISILNENGIGIEQNGIGIGIEY